MTRGRGRVGCSPLRGAPLRVSRSCRGCSTSASKPDEEAESGPTTKLLRAKAVGSATSAVARTDLVSRLGSGPSTPRLAEGFARALLLLGPSFAIVGAPGPEGGDAPVHDFSRTGAELRLRAELDSPERDKLTGDLYGECGAALASDGDLLFVGAPLESEWRAGQASCEAGGVVYVFDRRSDGAQPVATLRGTRPGESFGAALGICGDLLVVGASTNYSNVPLPGAVYLYRREAPHGWRLITRVEGESAGEAFGTRVAIDATRLVVTAPGRAAIGEPVQSGRADLFEIGTDGCVKVGSIRESQGLGVAVALKGDRLAIGESMFSAPGGKPQTGRVGLYRWPIASANVSCEGWLVAADAPPHARLGSSIALEDDYLAAGAPGLGNGDGSGFVAIKNW